MQLTFCIQRILDENEFYEQQKILKLDDYKIVANFLNNLLYNILANELIGNYYIT